MAPVIRLVRNEICSFFNMCTKMTTKNKKNYSYKTRLILNDFMYVCKTQVISAAFFHQIFSLVNFDFRK